MPAPTVRRGYVSGRPRPHHPTVGAMCVRASRWVAHARPNQQSVGATHWVARACPNQQSVGATHCVARARLASAALYAKLTASAAQPQGARMPDLSVIIVSYNTRDLLRDCLASLRASVGPSLEIIVVDNASSDGSAAMVQATNSPRRGCWPRRCNTWYCGGNNLGIRAAKRRLHAAAESRYRSSAGRPRAYAGILARAPGLRRRHRAAALS